MEEQQVMDHMEEPKRVSPLNVSLKFGFIGGLVMIITSLLYYLLDVQDNWWIGSLTTLAVIFVSVYFAQINHRDNDLGGYMKYGRGLGVGLLTTLFIAILSAIFTIVMVKFIDPGAIEQQLEIQRQAMIEQDMSDEQIEQSMQFARQFATNPLFLFFTAVFGTMIWGLIISLVSAAFTRK